MTNKFYNAYNILEHLNKCSSEEVKRMDDSFIQAEKNHNCLVSNVRSKLLSDNKAYELANLFKVFGDASRTRIMSALEVRDLCVCDIAEILDMSVSAVSHQLRVLRDAKLVKATKMGKEVMYSLDDDHVSQIFICGLSHVNEDN